MESTRSLAYPFAAGLAAALALAGPALAQSSVIVVDDGGGPGVAFTDLEPAVASASDGDLILVRPGSYGGASINDKALTIVADTGGPVLIDDGLAIRNLASHRRVVLHGLRVDSGAEEGLQIKSCAGQVWVEDCRLVGAQGDGAFTLVVPHENGYSGAFVSYCAEVVFVDCELVGGPGDDYAPSFAIHGWGAPGLTTIDSSVVLYDCEVTGGRGGDVFDDDFAVQGGIGGDGLNAVGGTLFLSGCAVTGGRGGIGGEDFDLFFGYSCGSGGAGGTGLFGANAGQPLLAQLLDTTVTGGQGGPPYPGAPCAMGPNGPSIVAPPTAVGTTPLPSASLGATAPVRNGQLVTLRVAAQPGSAYAIGISAAPALVPVAALNGVLLVDASVVLLPLGVVGPTGVATLPLVTNATIPVGQAVTAFAQGAVLLPASFVPVLTGATHLVVLDPAL